MEPDARWREIEALARSALERDASERPAFLDAACRGDRELRREVEELVATYELARRGDTVLSRPGFVPPPAVELGVGALLGPYRILGAIGEGTMATVYRAARDEDAGAVVAVKVARRGVGAAGAARHLETERLALARLDHPNIARLLESGTLADGRPYMAVEYVDGPAITEHCAQLSLAIPRRLGLFRQVCGAVDHAHRRRVIHRDIKPTNVLVTGGGVPKLLDFGIALWHEEDAAAIPLPSAAERPMTPQYASPEQVRGEAITPLSDVYSLGVLLYELLTGRLPYGSEARGPREMARLLAERDPPAPSAVAEGSAELRRMLERKLDRIVLKSLAREPRLRHQSAAQLAEEVRQASG